MRILVDNSVNTNFIDIANCRLMSREVAEKFVHAVRVQIEELWPKRKTMKKKEDDQ